MAGRNLLFLALVRAFSPPSLLLSQLQVPLEVAAVLPPRAVPVLELHYATPAGLTVRRKGEGGRRHLHLLRSLHPFLAPCFFSYILFLPCPPSQVPLRLPLPVVLGKLLKPTVVSPADFFSQWKALATPPVKLQEVVRSAALCCSVWRTMRVHSGRHLLHVCLPISLPP